MIVEGLEYYLQDLENDENFQYCEQCDSCGHHPCCSVDRCKFMQCMYKDKNLEDYHTLVDENEDLRESLIRALVFIRDKTTMLYPSLKDAHNMRWMMNKFLD